MRFEVGIQGIEKLKRLSTDVAQRLDDAEKRTVRILQQIGAAALRRRLTGEDRKRRSGDLTRSITAAEPLRRPGGVWEGRFGYGSGPSARYARILEDGGTITPKNAKVLSIPILAGLTGTGRARYESPKEVEGGFWITRAGLPPLFAVQRGGKNSQRLDILFVGAQRSVIKGKKSAERSAAEAQLRARSVLDEQVRLALSPAA